MAERWGRRWSLIWAGCVTCVGVAMQAGSNHSLAVMYVGRLVAGLGVGAASMLTPLYGMAYHCTRKKKLATAADTFGS